MCTHFGDVKPNATSMPGMLFLWPTKLKLSERAFDHKCAACSAFRSQGTVTAPHAKPMTKMSLCLKL
jgi:hypothetical protein